jgi:hypothetical protein
MSKHVLAAAAVFSLLCACSHSRTITTQDGSVSVADGKDGSSSIHAVGKDGSSMDLNTGKPITDYPSDVPLYSGKSVMDMKSGEKNARVVVLQTPDSLDKVGGFYKSQFDSQGWKTETSINTDKMVMYKASKDNRVLVVQIGADSGKTSISQTLADK